MRHTWRGAHETPGGGDGWTREAARETPRAVEEAVRTGTGCRAAERGLSTGSGTAVRRGAGGRGSEPRHPQEPGSVPQVSGTEDTETERKS